MHEIFCYFYWNFPAENVADVILVLHVEWVFEMIKIEIGDFINVSS